MSNEPDVKPAGGGSFSLIALILVIGAVLLLIVLLIPAVEQARGAARRSQSKNNLKLIGLALHNYHDTYNVLPPGGIFDQHGTPFHSWTTSSAPYFDASPFYSMVNMNVPWDDPSQLDFFMRWKNYCFENPRATPKSKPDGQQLLHYAGNSWMFYRNSSVTFKDVGDWQHTLLAGEVSGNFTPFGMPGNWRDVQLGLNASPDGFGNPNRREATDSLILMADGSVRAFEEQVDPAIWNSMAGPKSLQPTIDQTRRPEYPADLSKHPRWRNRWISDGKAGVAKLSLSPDRTTLNAKFDDHAIEKFHMEELNLPDETEFILREFEADGTVQHIRVSGPVKLEVLEVLSRPKKLQTLTLSTAEVKGDLQAFRKKLRPGVTID